MTNNEAIEVMCRRCSNHEVCNGTGCEPRNVLIKLIKETERINGMGMGGTNV